MPNAKMDPYPIKYTTCPELSVQYSCAGFTCFGELEADESGLTCNTCGTTWPREAIYDGSTEGQLYEEWSGEKRPWSAPLDPCDPQNMGAHIHMWQDDPFRGSLLQTCIGCHEERTQRAKFLRNRDGE